MKRMITVLALVLFASICAAQTTFSGALLIGRIESGGTAPAGYDPSTEFNSTDWPSGYGLMASGSGITLSGTAAILSNSSLFVATPAGDWTAEVLVTPSATPEETYRTIGLAINSQVTQGADEPYGISIKYGGSQVFYVRGYTLSGGASTSDFSATTVKLKVQKIGTELTMSYALDAGSYTVTIAASDSLPIATAGYTLGVFHLEGDVGDTVAVDYLRFTMP